MNRWTRVGWLVAMLAVLVALAAAAPQQVVETQLLGRGPSAAAATRGAVIEAVHRVNDSRVSFDQAKKRRFDDSVQDLDRTLAADDVTIERMQAEIRTLSRGLVDSLKVLDQRAMPDGTSFEVTVRVGVVPFATQLATRKTIAITTFQPARPTYTFGPATVDGKELSRRLADATIEHMVQAGVLTVLDRQHIEDLAREKNYVELYGKSPEELARFGKLLGADYLVVGTVEGAGLDIITESVKASGYTFSRALAGIEVKARLLEVETGAIRWADTVRVDYSNSDLARMFGGAAPDPNGTLGRLVEDASIELTGALVESIAPIKVALVDGETVWLNRGIGRLAPGMRLLIRGGGQEVRDPDTGESLGPAERTVAVVEVVTVDPKKAQCRLVEGDKDAVQVGQIARPMATVR